MTTEANLRDLADQICRLDLPFDPEAIVALLRGHVAVVPGGPRLPVILRVVEPGRLAIDSVASFAEALQIPEDQVAERIEILRASVALDRSGVATFWMSYIQNLGTRPEPNYIVALPKLAACQLF